MGKLGVKRVEMSPLSFVYIILTRVLTLLHVFWNQVETDTSIELLTVDDTNKDVTFTDKDPGDHLRPLFAPRTPLISIPDPSPLLTPLIS